MSAQTPPTPDQILQMMQGKMGDTLPTWPGQLKELAPDLLVSTAQLSHGSVQRPESTIPLKYRHLMAVAAALGRRQASCARSQARMAMQEGATREEVLDAVRIARHLMAAGILDAAAPILEDLAE
ncbi:carboxymuconolactone decarboxylase family protein [Geothrix fermentans]|jgi:alkylhydroperoxidase/carboxymuconolactone decarboxylase family protein YurZ|uniref:carboxymuconolactone decarboxylase family protein n=1 Tax=Geothrix fermentans TaxID=44676 RepID=UPI0004009902|nr:carboxymuconolactone decarboxylase family protein [Geothrix fermentans]